MVTLARESACLPLMLLAGACAAEHAPRHAPDEARDPASSERDAEAEGQPAHDAPDSQPQEAPARVDAAAADGQAAAAPDGDAAPAPDSDAAANEAAPTDGGADAGPAAQPRASCLRSGEDHSAPGSYPVSSWVVELDSRDPELAAMGHREAYTIFQPTILESACLHPVVVWGNDLTLPGTSPYGGLLAHLATWGVVAVAAHSPKISEAHFEAALEFVLAQNRAPASPLFGKLNEHVALAGHGQGAIAASLSSTHSAVASVVCLGDCRVPARGAGLLCLSGTSDTESGCGAAFEGAAGAAVLARHSLADRNTPAWGGTAAAPQYARLSAAWLRCQLDADARACAVFGGGDACSLCDEFVGWYDVRAKNL